ncbi:MAG TPA: divalent-cation tolerance protein CutA [Leptolyngbyaceae cyanobacterium M65_K2018_010]|nr:divalent-cation tolerance protein CutA [Leptolyngbyaceae cyanobacterium M65_K2018_010]
MNPSPVNPAESLGVVLVTIDTEANAHSLARQLVEAGLAACVSLSPIQSVYRWQGELHTDPEWQLVIKTSLTRLEELTQVITEHHPYDVPEIIALPIAAGFTEYLAWIGDQTQKSGREGE